MADAHCEHRLRRPKRLATKVPSLYMCSASLTLATLAHAAFRFIDASWSGVAVRGLWLAWAACGLMIRSDR